MFIIYQDIEKFFEFKKWVSVGRVFDKNPRRYFSWFQLLSNLKQYDCSNNLYFNYEPNGIPFSS